MIWDLCRTRRSLWIRGADGSCYFNIEQWVRELVLFYIRKNIPQGRALTQWMILHLSGLTAAQPLTYFSVWSLGLLCLERQIHGHRHSWRIPRAVSSILLDWTITSVIVCAVGGLYIAWIYPQHLFIGYLRLYVGRVLTRLIDVFAHQLPAVWILRRRFKDAAGLSAIPWIGCLPAMLYLLLEHSRVLSYYSLGWIDVARIGAVSLLSRILLPWAIRHLQES